MNGSLHRRPGGEPIIDQQDDPTGNDQRGSSFSIECFATIEFDHLPRDDRLDCRLIEAKSLGQIGVENTDSAGGKSAKGQFLVARDTQFSDRKKIEWEPENPGNLKGDRDAPSRKSENQFPGIVCVLAQGIGECPSRRSSILIAVIPHC